MNPRKFDELTKQLAKSTTRRHALRTILTASIGGVVGLGAIPSVFGNKIKCGGGRSNKRCAHWCHAVFGPNTPAAGQCTSDAAHNRGACCQCGAVDPSDICCVRDSNGFCVPGTIVAGCFCDSTQCQTCDASTGTCVGCPPGETCENGQCAPVMQCNNPQQGCTACQHCDCSPSGSACCAQTAEGGTVCAPAFSCGEPSCTSSSDCASGFFCIVNTCCPGGHCVPSCDTVQAGLAPRPDLGSGGPTSTLTR